MYTNERTAQLQRCTPVQMVLLARLLAVLPACLLRNNAVHIRVDLVLAVQPASVPPFPCSSGSASHTSRRCHPLASQRCLAGKRYSPFDRVDRASRPWARPRDQWSNVSKVRLHRQPGVWWRIEVQRSSPLPNQRHRCFLHCLSPFS